jgi:ribosomal protein L11 methyltransferase
MNDYYEVRLDMAPVDEDMTDLMAAMLGDIGFESFVPDTTGLTAYVKSEIYDADKVAGIIGEFPFETEISVMATLVEGRDWNIEWEKNYFRPIVVGDKCVIHSSFHKDFPVCKYDIVIDPKMAFGTGHHATTSLVINQLLDLNLEGKSMVDMGTGTGILAILAAMCGAISITAIEIDPMAYENAVENVASNGHSEVDVRLGDATQLDCIEPVDVFVANINRNIITSDLASYASVLHHGGIMLLSGFYEHDIPVIMETACKYGLKEHSHTVKDNWACLRLVRQ